MDFQGHTPEVLDVFEYGCQLEGVLQSVAVDVGLGRRTPVDICANKSGDN